MTHCKICDDATTVYAEAVIRKRYETQLLRCVNCGFLFIAEPTWLSEAYAEPINRSDTGYVSRNLWARDAMRRFIETNLNPEGVFLDYAAGYGLFVRLMRDAGYDCRWSDLYCANLFSQGFEAVNPLVGPFEAITAFEVFEHLTDPKEEMKILSAITPYVLFSTKLLPEPPPKLDDWWYYGLGHGQHVAFYTTKSLKLLAAQFGYHFTTDGADLHVFSRRPIRREFFSPDKASSLRWLLFKKAARLLGLAKERPERVPLTMADHDFIIKQISSGGAELSTSTVSNAAI